MRRGADLWTDKLASLRLLASGVPSLTNFCDISRDAKDNLLFDGDHVKSRNGAPPLKPEDLAPFNEIELRSHPWVRQ